MIAAPNARGCGSIGMAVLALIQGELLMDRPSRPGFDHRPALSVGIDLQPVGKPVSVIIMAIGTKTLLMTLETGFYLPGCCLQGMDDPESGSVASGNTLCAEGSPCQVEVQFAALVTVYTEGILVAARAPGVRFGGIGSVLKDPQGGVCFGRAQRSVGKFVLLMAGKTDLLFRYDTEGPGFVAGQTFGDLFVLVTLV